MTDTVLEDEIEPDELNVYLAGPMTDVIDAEQIRQSIRDESPDKLNIIDPMDLEPEMAFDWDIIRQDLTAVELCQAVLAYRVKGAETWGTPAELHHALRVGTPVVVFNFGRGGHNRWLTHPFRMTDDLDEAFSMCSSLARLYGTYP